MSALPPKADIAQHGGNVRFVPEAAVSNRGNVSLFDHLVGGHLNGHGHVEAKCLCGLEIEHELEFG
jgi:hypothetical protein